MEKLQIMSILIAAILIGISLICITVAIVRMIRDEKRWKQQRKDDDAFYDSLRQSFSRMSSGFDEAEKSMQAASKELQNLSDDFMGIQRAANRLQEKCRQISPAASRESMMDDLENE